MKYSPTNLKSDQRIQEAIRFLFKSIETSGHNPKPVILHSIRVGMNLARLGYPKEIVIAGLLHDVIEDSKATLKDVQGKFGSTVAKLVAACTYDEKIRDKTERYVDAMARACAVGKRALVVMAADLADNIPYYRFARRLSKDRRLRAWLDKKATYFVEISKKRLEGEPILEDLKTVFRDHIRNGK